MKIPKFVTTVGSKCLLIFLDKKFATYEKAAAQFDHFIVADSFYEDSIGFVDCDTSIVTENGVSVTPETTWIDLPRYEYGETWIAYEVV